MSKNKGWIKLHRKIQDSPDYFKEAFCRNMAWVDLLLLAQHKETYERVRGVRIKTERGQVGLSIVELAKRWRWSRGKVFRFLNELELDNQIVQQKDNVTTLISILNYENYQNNDTANDTADGQQMIQQTGSRRAADPCNELETNELQATKNDKNDKEEKNIGGKGGFASPNPPPNFFVARDGSMVIEPNLKLLASDFNGLPEKYLMMAKSEVWNIKRVLVEPEQITACWESYKELEVHKKLYRNKNEVYGYFVRYCTSRSWGKGKSAATKKQKTLTNEKVFGVEFTDDFTKCKMSDGSVIDLNRNQSDSAKANMINPSSIVKK